jgi:hypothetical protein
VCIVRGRPGPHQGRRPAEFGSVSNTEFNGNGAATNCGLSATATVYGGDLFRSDDSTSGAYVERRVV